MEPIDLIPIREAAQLHPSGKPGKRLHFSTLWRWVLQGKLRSWTLGGRRLVSRREVLDLLKPDVRVPLQLDTASEARQRQEAAKEKLRAMGWA